ncbi:MAG: GNAT family N-acetyltransferase [Pseudonocardiaceae bacterium]
MVTELYTGQLTHYDRAAGCGGYRIHDPTTGEIKRLYVRPEHQGQGQGNVKVA